MGEAMTMNCPFCDSPDFDMIGLKAHILKGQCDVFEGIDTVEQERERNLAFYQRKEMERQMSQKLPVPAPRDYRAEQYERKRKRDIYAYHHLTDESGFANLEDGGMAPNSEGFD